LGETLVTDSGSGVGFTAAWRRAARCLTFAPNARPIVLWELGQLSIQMFVLPKAAAGGADLGTVGRELDHGRGQFCTIRIAIVGRRARERMPS